MDILQFSENMDALIPKTLSEPWDNDGIMILPYRNAEVKKAVIALDATDACMEKAEEIKADVTVTHHPLIFSPVSSLSDTDPVCRRIIRAVRSGISVFSYHTRLDCVENGVADSLIRALGFTKFDTFCRYIKLGTLDCDTEFSDFSAKVSELLREKPMCMIKCGKVRKVACAPGSGKDFIKEAYDIGADTFVTGEVSHSAMIDCRELGMNLLCMTHYATERVVLKSLEAFVKKACPGTETYIFDFERVREYGI